jgi:hypothetical protein
MKTEETKIEYTKPEVRDYGKLRELTLTQTTSGTTDVPIGTFGTQVFS